MTRAIAEPHLLADLMSVDAFSRKWRAVELKERSAAQEHFLDLCRVVGEPSPAEADPTGDFYCFERGATKASGGEGWADVWKRGHFGWEYNRGARADLIMVQQGIAPGDPQARALIAAAGANPDEILAPP